MGAVMAIKHLAGKAESCDKAIKLFSMCLLFYFSNSYMIYNKVYDKLLNSRDLCLMKFKIFLNALYFFYKLVIE